MTRNLAVALLVYAACVSGQVHVSIVQSENELPLAGQATLTPVPVGVALDSVFRIRNAGPATATIQGITMWGSEFRIVSSPPMPVFLKSGAHFDVTLRFQAWTARTYSGILDVNGHTVLISASAVAEAVIPRPRLLIEPNSVESGRQASLSIRFASLGVSAGEGRLKLEFVPLSTGAQDPAVQFLPSGREIKFTVKPGEDFARFGERTDVRFQTGTTAGAIVLTAEVGGYSDKLELNLLPKPPVLDSTKANRSAGKLEVSLTGFDNMRAPSRLAFMFFDAGGNMLGPGRIEVDPSQDFRRYFEASALGGMFSLKAVFPVQGDVQRVAEVEVQLANAMGQAGSGRIKF